jgi:23S rRNA (guanine745-N1)-methyltransferase
VSNPPLSCGVRNCGLPLTRHERAFVCPSGHSFDLARSGYVNLLQPQDRRSTSAGDSKLAVHARAALERSGVGLAVIEAVITEAIALGIKKNVVVVDLGSGTGEMLGQLSSRHPVTGIGIDLSAAAAELAARRFPALTWIVANADRRLPLQDASVDVVLSIHGRRNPRECARVLTANGLLFAALPAADDLIELRTLVQGHGVERDRAETMLGEHRTRFELVERLMIRQRLALERDALLNLLRSTYRGARFKLSDRVETVSGMEVTLSSDVVMLRRLHL